MSVNRNTTVLEKLPLPEQQLVSKRKKKEQQRWSASATALKESYHSSSQQFILGGVQTKIVNSIQRLLQFLSNSGKPPLGTSAPCPGSRQNPLTPWIVLRTSRNVFLGGPPVVPAFPIHPGTSNKSECFLEHEPGLKAPGMALPQGGLSLVEPGWQQLASLLSPVPTLRKKTNPLITMPVQYDYCTRGTKWPHLGEKKILIKMQYHANSFVLFGTRFKQEQRLPLSRLLRLQHSTKKLPGKRKALQLQHAWIWHTFFFKIEKYF